MKKAFTIFALFAVLLLTSSAYTETATDKATARVVAPDLVLENDIESFSLSSMRGRYVLLSFWSSTDARSRVACNDYTALLKRDMGNKQICHVSINFDRSEALFEEIVRRDNLEVDAQFNVQGELAANIKRNFNLESGFETILIDPAGVVVAANPSAETLMQL